MKRRRQICEYWFRARVSEWCGHVLVMFGGEQLDMFTPWRIVDGMRKWRWCTRCGRSEWV